MKRLAIGGLSILLLGAYVYADATDFFRIDGCLDSGGSWHYDERVCSMTDSYQGPR
ncbi:hypothetical protein [Parasphingorhabdus sp.]|uniref:hypothetical protein n=1 Tax=Parasphingorhabdus sp. TaxID=2709688 RepID=UPI0032678B58